MKRFWTTADLPPREQFSYWREVICEAFAPLTAQRKAAHSRDRATADGLDSWVRSSALTGTNCAEVSSKSQLISHGESDVRRTVSEQVFVNLQLSGRCVGSQDGRTCLVEPGSFALFDTTSRYDLEFLEDPSTREWRVLSFRVPRQHLLPLLARSHGFTAVTRDSGTDAMANLVVSTMDSIWRNIQNLDRREADAAESAFVTTLAASAGGLEVAGEARREVLDDTLRASINQYVASHLRTADMAPPTVARRFAISLRKLHSLYAGTGMSFTQTVMSMRVEASARDLAASDLSITDIAAKWGFYDLSHLNRVFRSHRGCLPSEFRESSATTHV